MSTVREGTSEGLDAAARAGLVAYGVLHLLVAWVATELALGHTERDSSGQGALQQLAAQPFGWVLVWAIAVGMFAFMVQRVVQGWSTGKLRPWAKAAVYAAVGASAVGVATGSGGGGTSSERSMSARVMDLPGGSALVVLVGLVILGVGLHHGYRGLTRAFRDELSAGGRAGDSGTVYLTLGQVGYAAKGVVIGLVGLLVAYAGISHDPEKSGGLDEALRTVRDQPFGPTLLIAAACGIACYGLFCFAQARHPS